jgi:hypothetical protein
MARKAERSVVAVSEGLGAAGDVYRTAAADELLSGMTGIVSGVGGVMFGRWQIRHHGGLWVGFGEEAPLWLYGPILIPLSVLFGCVGLLMIKSSLQTMRWTTRLFEHGMVRSRGRRSVVYPWSEVELRLERVGHLPGVPHSGFRTGKLGRASRAGKQQFDIETDHRPGWSPGGLVEAIEENVVRVRLPIAAAQLAAGEEVDFGPVAIGPQGIRKGPCLIAWPDVNRLSARGPYFTASSKTGDSPSLKCAVGKIPNFAIFWEFARALHEDARSEVDGQDGLRHRPQDRTLVTDVTDHMP